MEWKNLDECKTFSALKNEEKVSLPQVFNAQDAVLRIKTYSVDIGSGLKLNYSAKPVDGKILSLLQNLADEQQAVEKYKLLLSGEFINTGENRMVLHHLTRGQLCGDVVFNGINMRRFYLEQLEKIKEFVFKVHSGKIKTPTGKKFTDVVQIGIGGSDLGPRALYLAIKNWAIKNNKAKLSAHFISNVDPDDCNTVLRNINLETALFILVSKSGTTQETLANECFVKSLLQKHGLDSSKQMLAVTAKTSPLANSPHYLTSFYMDDFIGGRYSSTSVCGAVVLALAFGMDVVEEFLNGAAETDKLALQSEINKNGALLDALLGVYERNILGYSATAILPYSQALSRFPAHLQQLDMESNGKTVNRFGEPVSYKTGPIIFGEPGTNGQHSFYQLLHQGSDIIPLQFIGFREPQFDEDVTVEGSTNSEKLTANLISQIVAFAAGKFDKNRNKNFEGGRPSTLIYGKTLTPKSLGSLLSHFENKVMFQGFLWNLNSFDQEGVQLGKILTKKILSGCHNTESEDSMLPALNAFSRLLCEL